MPSQTYTGNGLSPIYWDVTRPSTPEPSERSLTGKQELLRYDKALAAGWPIAAGAIEGACRHLIGDRLDITRARRELQGAEAVLTLRAVISNGDFEYWRCHLTQEHQRLYPGTAQGSYALSA